MPAVPPAQALLPGRIGSEQQPGPGRRASWARLWAGPGDRTRNLRTRRVCRQMGSSLPGCWGRAEGGRATLLLGKHGCSGLPRHVPALSVKGAGQHFTEQGVARCQQEGDREEHMAASTNKPRPGLSPAALARSRVEAAGGWRIPVSLQLPSQMSLAVFSLMRCWQQAESPGGEWVVSRRVG